MSESFAHGLVGVTLDDRYRLDAVLGEGGMGAVFRATQLAMDRKVAVKLLKPHLTGDRSALERFAREARSTQKVESPNAVKVLDFGVTPQGDYYMVLEYLDGRTVQRELEVDGAFGPARVAHIAGQALAALAAAHRHGLVHRDIKPDNLLLMRHGEDADYTKVLDFGVAKLMQGASGATAQLALTGAGMVFGTPAFMSPEQALGQELDGRSDLYSLAATMFAMLTGRALFEGKSAIEILTHHARTPAPRLATVRSELAGYGALDDLLQRCLDKTSDERPDSAEAMARELAALAPGLVRAAVPRSSAGACTLPPGHSSYIRALSATELAAPVQTPRPHDRMATAETAAGSLRDPAPSLPRHARWWGAGVAVIALTGGLVLQRSDEDSDGASSKGSPRSASISTSGTTSRAASGTGESPSATSPSATSPSATSPSATSPSATSPSATSPSATSPSALVSAPTSASQSARPAPPAPSGATAGTSRSASAGASIRSSTAGTASTSSRAGAGPTARNQKRVGAAAGTELASDRTPQGAGATQSAAPGAAEDHLRNAETALRAHNPLRQLAEADLALRADPRSARARYLLGDALIKSGDLDRGCEYLRGLMQLPEARDRARSAGCPGD